MNKSLIRFMVKFSMILEPKSVLVASTLGAITHPHGFAEMTGQRHVTTSRVLFYQSSSATRYCY